MGARRAVLRICGSVLLIAFGFPLFEFSAVGALGCHLFVQLVELLLENGSELVVLLPESWIVLASTQLSQQTAMLRVTA